MWLTLVALGSPALTSVPTAAERAELTSAAVDLELHNEPTCFGPKATIKDYSGRINGAPGDDVIVGDSGPSRIDLSGAVDRICTNGGNDLIGSSSTGQTDRLFADGGGADVIAASSINAGLNLIDGGDGNDLVTGNSGNDEVRGGDGDDRVLGAPGNDRVAGGTGVDTLVGNDGAKTLTSGKGADTCDEDVETLGAPPSPAKPCSAGRGGILLAE